MSVNQRMSDSKRSAPAEASASERARPRDSGSGTRDEHGDEPFDPFRFQIRTLPRGLRAQMLRFELPLIPPEELMERVPLSERARVRLRRGWTWLDQLLWARRIPAGVGLIALAVLALGLAIVQRPHEASSQGDLAGDPDHERQAGAGAERSPAEPPTVEIEPAGSVSLPSPSAPVERKLAGGPPSSAGSTAPATSAAGVGSRPASGQRIKKFFIPD